jgi:hypothetical protein
MLKNKIVMYAYLRERLQWKSFFCLGKVLAKKDCNGKRGFVKNAWL